MTSVPYFLLITVWLSVSITAILIDTGLVALPVPGPRRQVPPQILNMGMRRAGLLFGLQMGTGVMTYVTAAAPYIVWVASGLGLVSGIGALFAGIGFGAARGIIPLIRLRSTADLAWGNKLQDFVGRARTKCALATFLTTVSVVAFSAA